MDSALIRRWAAEGYLPTFQRLLQSAAWTDYLDPPEHSSGTQWSSINTGFGPLRHDFFFATRFCQGSYRTRMGRADDLKKDPFWKWFAKDGRRIVIADVPFMIPTPAYGGLQFWGWGVHDWPWHRSSVPDELLSRLEAQHGCHPIHNCHNHTTATESLLDLKRGLLTAITRRTAIMRSLLEAGTWDLFYGVYSEPHCAGHLMWHLEDKAHPRYNQDQLAIVGHALRELYTAIDTAIGQILNMLPLGTAFAVICSHGMGPNYHGADLFPTLLTRFNQRWVGHQPDANQGDGQGGILNRFWLGSVGRIPSSWRTRVKHSLPVSLRAWISMKRFQSHKEWSQAFSFSVPQDGFSSVRVNLVGREPEGKIRPGEEYKRYVDTLVDELMRLTNTDSNQPAVERIFRADQQVDPVSMGSGTDLIIWWSQAAGPIRGIRSANLGLIEEDSSGVRTGNHVMRGLFLISHPDIRPGQYKISGMNSLDIAPTLCDLANIQSGCTMEGTSRYPGLARAVGRTSGETNDHPDC